MIYLSRSQVDAKFVEVREDQCVLQEVQILFPIRTFPKSFSSLTEALQWLHETEIKLTKKKAYQLLAQRAYPSIALLKKLEEKGFSKLVCEKVIEDFKEIGFLQDDDFWENLIRKEWARGYGPRYLEWKKKIPKAKIAAFITKEMQRQKIRELAKKFPSPKKAFQVLIRRGFDLDCMQGEIRNGSVCD